MARKCDCDRILDMVNGDARLRVMGLAATAFWLLLVQKIKDLGVDGVLRWGYAVGLPFGSLREVAFACNALDTDWETQITEFVRRGLLQQPAPDCLALPIELQPTARQLAARENGRKGGRPRKTQAPPGQTEMLMPIGGGRRETAAEKPTETQQETQMQTEADGLTGARESLSLASAEKDLSKLDEREFHRIGQAALAAAGFDLTRGPQNYGLARQWMADGADFDLVIGTIEAVMARPGGARPSHLGYFTAAIRDALANRPQPTSPGFDAFEAAMRAFFDNGQRGTPPRLEDFVHRAA